MITEASSVEWDKIQSSAGKAPCKTAAFGRDGPCPYVEYCDRREADQQQDEPSVLRMIIEGSLTPGSAGLSEPLEHALDSTCGWEQSRALLFLSGHGGDAKFQDFVQQVRDSMKAVSGDDSQGSFYTSNFCI